MKKGLIIFLKIVIFFVGWAVLSGIVNIPSDNPAIWRFFAELIPLVVIILFTIIFLCIEKRTVKIPVIENVGRGTATGVIVGLAWIGISSGILIFTHQLTIIKKIEVPMLWLWITSAFFNVVMQELLVRGYIYQLLKSKYNIPVAIVVTTAMFTLLHGGAFEVGLLPVINVITMCLFTTALYESEKTIIAPTMAHAVWNIIGAIVLGVVSLADDYPRLYTFIPSGNEILSGGNYDIEASVVVLVINIILMLFFYYRYKKKAVNA